MNLPMGAEQLPLWRQLQCSNAEKETHIPASTLRPLVNMHKHDTRAYLRGERIGMEFCLVGLMTCDHLDRTR